MENARELREKNEQAYLRQNGMIQKNLKEILEFNLFICRKQN